MSNARSTKIRAAGLGSMTSAPCRDSPECAGEGQPRVLIVTGRPACKKVVFHQGLGITGIRAYLLNGYLARICELDQQLDNFRRRI